MAAVASSSSYHAFAPSISQSSSSSQFQNQNAHDGESFDENLVNTLFCKALYDYEAQDPSALSFKRGDIIEVLTQQPSGWWDGLLGDERGWFPSNYVEVISDEEAEVALSGGLSDLDQHSIDQQSLAPSSSMSQASSMPRMASDADSGMVDMSHAMLSGGAHLDADEWLDAAGMGGGGMDALAHAAMDGPTQSNDFWMPQVTPGGQIYYVNTQTGQQSRDLPVEAEDDGADSDLAGLAASVSSSRSGTSRGLALANGGRANGSAVHPAAGFGVPRRTDTPEPWVRKLADDGMAYYYYNQVDGSIQWTKPEGGPPSSADRSQSATPSSRQRAYSEASQHSSYATTQDYASGRGRSYSTTSDHRSVTNSSYRSRQHEVSRLSVYSDSSDLQPFEALLPASRSRVSEEKGLAVPEDSGPPTARLDARVELSTAEELAQQLQDALSPPPPESAAELSIVARSAITAIVDFVQSMAAAAQERPEVNENAELDSLVNAVVDAVRNLLFVAAPPPSQMPNAQGKVDRAADKAASQSPLKPAQRKVTATLSRLVLSARALRYDAGAEAASARGEAGAGIVDTLQRIEVDAEELERALHAFVLEVGRSQHTPHSPSISRRLHGVFSSTDLGLGLLGAGAAGSWKGFGFVPVNESDTPRRALSGDVVEELVQLVTQVDILFTEVKDSFTASGTPVEEVRGLGTSLIAQINTLLTFVADVHVAKHVDVDGIRRNGNDPSNDAYARTVERARSLVRALEAATQAVYDDLAAFVLSIQTLPETQSARALESAAGYFEVVSGSLKSNVATMRQTISALLAVGREQADIDQGDYSGSIELRLSRLSIMPPHTAARPDSDFFGAPPNLPGDVVGMEDAFRRPAPSMRPSEDPSYRDTIVAGQPSTANGSSTVFGQDSETDLPETDLDMDDDVNLDDDFDDMKSLDGLGPQTTPSKPPRGSSKLKKILGEIPTFIETTAISEQQPWYLRPTYNASEIIIDNADGTVKGGTVPALVERLTAHEHGDPTYIRSFLMTFKSFTTLDELFDLLVQRFWIQPPPKLTPEEREDWGKNKQHIIQMRVLNTFKSMVVDEDVLEKEDMYILDRMKQFVTTEPVKGFGAARVLLAQIERAQRGGNDNMKMVTTGMGTPPQPILPKANKKLKLLDIDPIEMARQLTLMESELYQRIRPMECLQRAREGKTDNVDNITVVIQTSNKIALWVAELVLSKDDSRRRAQVVKHLISIADRCRSMNNFSSMIAIVSGLNTPPIRRLKRTWEQVNQRFMQQFAACEMTIHSDKNFNKYRQIMATVNPPCVPFIGVFLSTLQFIQDGNPDKLPGDLVNFRKRAKASEVIQDIKRWQAQPFNFTRVTVIQNFIEESLNQFSDAGQWSDHFWTLSLEREPREREDEKMARLLQESGFL
ncbi:hypothetical protein EV714DRAFT_242305 [Schizophyllum commune]